MGKKAAATKRHATAPTTQTHGIRSQRDRRALDCKQRKLRRLARRLQSGADDGAFQELRALAFARGGFVSNELRQVIWPLLLGTDAAPVVHREHEQHFTRMNAPHRDDSQVEKDIERSMWHYDVVLNIREGERRAKRKQLTTIINAVLNDNQQLYYFQGYHDTCSVFLLVLGDQRSFHAMRTLSATYHREPMRSNFDTVLHTIRLLFPLLEGEDAELFQHLRESGVEPFFALPWVITWFAHELSRFSDVTRLYDVFLVSHPLFVLYTSAAVVLEARQRVLRAECDFGTLHSLLSKLPKTMDLEKVLARAAVLFHRLPPDELARHSAEEAVVRQTTFLLFPFSFQSRFPTITQPFLKPAQYRRVSEPLARQRLSIAAKWEVQFYAAFSRPALGPAVLTP
ncbi:hypothetical protein P43SY_008299 [Pythium insidiosum]|uniref:Rab-GAP TBC domain-containing protein n=1 Tax=Pythium insidiosum TaxID=114742 RepID=A0AAD5LP65_PYTIN|nr:hypothetical protein P43SY_008299 [Pythium insidiosum]